ncbi:glycerol-3-phosphate dehydrogenase [NAD+] [Ramicandelaber brevisporus]|nr:glycerol-3-phosphate dehydrogenase [NAD+] [Ramicandelaber brevisporus]
MTIARIIGRNVLLHPTEFEPEVQMWVYEETLADGRKLTDVINNDHENPKYLPGKLVPSNVIANPDLVSSAKGATALVFVLPHQFVARTCQDLKKGNVLGANCKAISLIKGFDDSDCTDGHISLISDLIARELGVDVSVLSGANIANEVADEKFCETTIGYRHVQHGAMFQRLFQTPNFHVGMVHDVDGVEICGALKNVVAIAAGLVDGLSYGDNTKAAIIRMGLSEMRKFAYIFATSHGRTISTETFFESCGVADLITTCAGGRNRKVAEAFAKTGRPFAELEKEMLNGQKLQGTLTSNEVYGYLKKHDLLQDFPLFVKVYKVCYEGVPAKAIVSW